MAYHLDIADPVISSESPWEDDITAVPHAHEAEWAKLSSDFTNSGYREGITAGKEDALQEGFDAGFAEVGVPLGQELGLLRGLASALQSYLASMPPTPELETQLAEAREIAEKLAEVRFSDIAPRDLEAEQHAREHLQDGTEELDENDELAEKRRVEQLEDMMNRLTAGAGGSQGGKSRPTIEDVQMLKARLDGLMAAVGLDLAAQRNVRHFLFAFGGIFAIGHSTPSTLASRSVLLLGSYYFESGDDKPLGALRIWWLPPWPAGRLHIPSHASSFA